MMPKTTFSSTETGRVDLGHLDAETPKSMDELIRLKNGHEVEVRPVAIDDAPALAALDRALVTAGDGMVLVEEDLPADAASESESVTARLERHHGKEGLWLVVPSDKPDAAALGQAAISRLGQGLLRHVAVLDVGVHPSAQGLGLGRALMERIIAWAQEEPTVSRLELYVRADNPRARRLYESLGFELEGVRRRFVRTKDGTFVDDLVMARLL